MKFEKEIAEYNERKAKAMAMGGQKKMEERKAAGILNARERIDYLADPGTFLESGLFATSLYQKVRDKSPADGKIAGFAKIAGRETAVVSNDFTVMGASSSYVNGKKIGHMKAAATRQGMPMIFLGESTGARMPDSMGATNMGIADSPTQYLRTRETPWVSAVLGYCFGSSAWYTALADFVVMRKGSILAVSSPRLIAMATREAVDPEAMGGWQVHAQMTGLVDRAVDTDEEALDAVKIFLSYLPAHHNEAPPRMPVPEGSDTGADTLLDLLPDSPTRVYDVKRIIKAVVDKGSMFEMKELFARNLVTALTRIDGRSVGIIANNPMFKGAAVDADACDKAISFIVLCDSFNIPLLFMVDQPGFLIGMEAEKKRMPGKIMNWMNALTLCTVPKISLILRKNYGQAFLNMGGGGNASEVAAWWTGEVGFMDPVAGATVVYNVKEEDDPERFKQCVAEMKRDTSAYDMAAVYGTHAVIDPRETRRYLSRLLEVYQMRITGGIGQHLMRTWPTSY